MDTLFFVLMLRYCFFVPCMNIYRGLYRYTTDPGKYLSRNVGKRKIFFSDLPTSRSYQTPVDLQCHERGRNWLPDQGGRGPVIARCQDSNLIRNPGVSLDLPPGILIAHDANPIFPRSTAGQWEVVEEIKKISPSDRQFLIRKVVSVYFDKYKSLPKSSVWVQIPISVLVPVHPYLVGCFGFVSCPLLPMTLAVRSII